MDISKNIEKFIRNRDLDARNASFDYCFNYFHSFYEDKKIIDLASKDNIDMSCFQLGFYLASWGMFRWSSRLPDKSIRYYRPLIEAISKMNQKYWEIDVDKYDDDNIKMLLECRKQ